MSSGKRVRLFRRISQTFFLLLFAILLIRIAKLPLASNSMNWIFIQTDIFLQVLHTFATRSLHWEFLFVLIPLMLTFLFGRVVCGWVCPLGTLNHLVSHLGRWLGRQNQNRRSGATYPQHWLNLKYLILIAALVMALAGINTGAILDPVTILIRSGAVVGVPTVGLIHETKFAGDALDLEAMESKRLLNYSPGAESYQVKAHTQAVATGLLLLVILLANFYKPRFFCHVLCPLGAVYGFLSRYGWLRVTRKAGCNSCGLCMRECLVCYTCVDHCPSEAVTPSRDSIRGKGSDLFALRRRQVLGAVSSGIGLAVSALISPSRSEGKSGFVRPPGAAEESTFLNRCLRCGACVQSCPTNFIQLAGLEAGAEALWTPVVNAELGYCEYDCSACTTTCPTEALKPLTRASKKWFRIGLAVVDRNRCYTYVDGIACTVCERYCPFPEKAIRFREVETWNFEGKKIRVNQIYVVPDLCNGCGICQYVCPRRDGAGITISAENEQRAIVT
jgi:MauM/NapG family ferredoxin protein